MPCTEDVPSEAGENEEYLDYGSIDVESVATRPSASAESGNMAIWPGAQRLTIGRQTHACAGKGTRVGGGQRGVITEFTRRARSTLRRHLAVIDLKHEGLFATLTYPCDHAAKPEEYRRHRERLCRRLGRRWKETPHVFYGRLEFHESGAPHIHAVVYGIPMEELEPWLWLTWLEVSETANLDHPEHRLHLEPVRSKRGAALYLAKPDKHEPEDPHGLWGRRWWEWGDPRPFRSTLITEHLPERVATRMHRYMQRYARIPARDYRSLSIVCDPSQWARLVNYEREQHADHEARAGE